jgi:AcrR family transcriptional regulator
MKEFTSKDTETRTQEIITAARQLFSQKGYQATSIDEIARAVGVTKGSIYHHFENKEAILEAVADALSAAVIDIVHQAAARQDLNAVQKINRIVEQTYAYRIDRRQEYRQLASSLPIQGASPDAAVPGGPMRKLLFEKVLNAVLDPFVAILRQGIQEGTFDLAYPQEAARFYLRIADLLRDELAVLAASGDRQAGLQTVRFYEQALERVLAAPAGSFEFTKVVMAFFFPVQGGQGPVVRS